MAGATIGSLRVALGLDSAKFEAGVSRAGASTQALQRQFRGLSAAAARVDLDPINRQTRRGRVDVQGMAFQLQDLSVQLQAGTAASIALSQQLPQMLGSFGAFGAVLGLVAALGIPAVANLVDLSEAGAAASASMSRLADVLPSVSGTSNIIAEALTGVAGNLDRIAVYGATAAGLFAGKYAAGMVAAALATGGLSGALTVLRGALIRTGIGALVVGAGEMVFQFTRLVRATGGFGNALDALRAVAVEVWERIANGSHIISGTMQVVMAKVRQVVLSTLADLAHSWNGFLNSLASGFDNLPGMGEVAFQLRDAAIAAGTSVHTLRAESEDAAFAVEAFSSQIANVAMQATRPLESIGALTTAVGSMSDEFGSGGGAASDLSDELAGGGGGGGGGGVAGAAEEAAEAVANLSGVAAKFERVFVAAGEEAEAFRKALGDAIMTAEDLGKAKADALVSGIEGISDAFGDFVSRGFRDFKSFASGVWQSFTGLIGDMVSLAARNRIMIALGITGGGATPAAAGGVGQAATGGIMSSIGGALGNIGAGLWTGASNVVGGLFSGGLGGAGAAISEALAGASAGLGGLATAVGALAVPVAAVAGLFFALRKRTELLDHGLRVSVDRMGALVETFREERTSRLFGLIKNTSTDLDPASADVAGPIAKAYRQVFRNVTELADVLGVGARRFKDFSHTFRLSLEGMTDEQKEQALAEEFGRISDSLARTAGVTGKLIREGETATQALDRLASGLTTANAVMDTLGHTVFEASLQGADAASRFVQAFGGMQEAAQAAEYYFANFYTVAERTREAAGQFKQAVGDLGIVRVPKSIEGFRNLVDILLERGATDKAAGLIALADDFKGLLDLRDQLSQAGGSGGGSFIDNAAAQEREQLERRLWELQGKTGLIRRAELAALDPANRALLRQIWALEKQERAADRAGSALDRAADREERRANRLQEIAQRAADEREDLERRILELTGQTAELRRRELLDLLPANRGLLRRIWALEKEAEIAEDREDLEERYLELTGNTAELRRRELEALDASLRPMQQLIWNLEDAKEAAEALNATDFASIFDFRKAQALAAGAMGGTTSTGVPLPVVPGNATLAVQQDQARAIQKVEERLDHVTQVLLKIEGHTYTSARIDRKFDADGMPPVRA